MDKKDLVRRTQSAAWRSAKQAPTSVQRSWYQKDLRTLGRDRPPIFSGKRAHEEIESWGELLTRPGTILVLFLLVFVLVLGALLWSEGVFKGAAPKLPSKAWMAGGSSGRDSAIDDSDAMATDEVPNEMERALNPQVQYPEEPAAEPDEPELVGEIIEE